MTQDIVEQSLHLLDRSDYHAPEQSREHSDRNILGSLRVQYLAKQKSKKETQSLLGVYNVHIVAEKKGAPVSWKDFVDGDF